jgi:23S rRNA (cytosine1962-C5)-methyltransferase
MTHAPEAPADALALPELRLKPREGRRLNAGHLWVFSNEVDTERTPLTGFAPGAL